MAENGGVASVQVGPNNSVISVTMPGASSPNSQLQQLLHQQQQQQQLNNNAANSAANTQSVADYLAQLLKDKKQLAALPNVFHHVERLLDDGNHFLIF